MRDVIPAAAGCMLDEYDAPRFWSRVNLHGGTQYESDPLATATGECWLWTGTHDREGYGQFRAFGRLTQAHRIAYRDFGHKLPDDQPLDHLCRVHPCVRPSHVEPVTTLENVLRGINGNKTHCPHGHAYTPENTVDLPSRDARYCRTCLKASKHRTYERTLLRLP